MQYSKMTNGFYDNALKELYGDNWPNDLIEITDTAYYYLLKGQTEGKVIISDETGAPILVDSAQQYTIINSITKRQAMLQLDSIDLYDDILNFINQSESKILKIEFEYSSIFERNSPVVLAMAEQFKLSDEQVDLLFAEAVKL